MAIMWFAKDGPRPDTQSGDGIDISLGEINAIFPGKSVRYCGLEAPNINADTPSRYVKNLVIQVCEQDGINERFSKIGFYYLAEIDPSDAARRLKAWRAST